MRRPLVCILTSFVALATACGGPTTVPAVPVACSFGTHPKEDCSLAFNLDSTNVQGSVSAFSFVNASGAVSSTAIRNVNAELMGYAVKRRDLCNEWNSCALDPKTYQTMTTRLEDSLTQANKHGQELQAAAAANNTQAAVQAFQQVQAATSFTLEFTASAVLPTDMSKVPDSPCPAHAGYAVGSPQVLGAGDPLPTGAQAWFAFRTTAPVYVYLLQRTGANKQLVKLFPDPRIPVPNPIPSGGWVRIPYAGMDAQGHPVEQSFCLDENDIGLDRVFIIASLNEVPSFDDAMKQIDSGNAKTIDTANPTLQAVDALPTSVDQLPAGCDTRSRGFVLDDNGQPPTGASPAGAPASCPPRSRGFVLDSHASNPASQTSFTAMSDPGQNAMLVKVFPYQHTPKSAPTGTTPAAGGARTRDIMIEQ
jgi:hypothetical protein